jgi:hypothetical protein
MALAVTSLGACKKENSGGASTANEVVDTAAPIDLPAPPTFVDPTPNPDGTHKVVEMRRKGGQFMKQPVKITGYVLYKYDCAAVLGADVIKEHPEQCERPHFYIGDEPNTTFEKSVWVVEVPRAPREDEKKNLPKSELNDPTKWPPEPQYAQGDKVVVEGTWDTTSPRGFVNSDGLLVYSNMTVITPAAPAPGGAASPTAPGMPGRRAPRH